MDQPLQAPRAGAQRRTRRSARRQLAWRLLHFILLGGGLFVATALGGAYREPQVPAAAAGPVIISRARIDQLVVRYREESGLPVSAADEAALIDREIDDELLYREALAHGLDRGDRSVRFRMIEKMRFLSDDDTLSDDELYRRAAELGLDQSDIVIRRMLVYKMRLLTKRSLKLPEPTDAELLDYMERHRSQYLQPGAATFDHVYFSADRRGPAVDVAAAGALERLRSGPVAIEDALALGDPFALGQRFTAASRTSTAKLFGPEFAADLMAAEPRAWTGPIRSAYGLHLVLITELKPERLPSVDEVRSSVRLGLREERQEAHLQATLAALRNKYEVRVESADPHATETHG